MKNQYVLLTGSKNNAGDFLIKDRAKELLSWLRPDRTIIDRDGWRPFDHQTLLEVNDSRGLILMGGPALQEKMRPRVYGLIEDLEKIHVPIITMGIGWYSAKGDWNDTHRYPLSHLTLKLLEKIDRSGYTSSVRDYHTMNVLNHYGFKNFMMTGCPALYSRNHLNDTLDEVGTLNKVGFSLGVSLKTSKKMFEQMQDVVLKLRDALSPATLVVAFHHGLNEQYLRSPGASQSLFASQHRFKEWLDVTGIPYQDISGSAELLKNFYQQCDLHVGYRVHAHIFMTSISKPSVLINEDGRGKALALVLGGVNFNSYDSVCNNIFVKAMHKVGFTYDNFRPTKMMAEDVAETTAYETRGGVRLSIPRNSINRHFRVMKSFVEQLP